MTKALLKDWLGSSRVLAWAQRADTPRVAVLMYHDLCEDGDLDNWMRVPVSRFLAQLSACAEVGAFVAPADLEAPERLPRDRLSFLLTFDDGYVNNARLAAPLLRARGIPALFCVSTGPVSRGDPFWTDVVVTPLQARRLTRLDLGPLGLGEFRFRAAPAAGRWDDIQRLLVAIKALGNEDQPPVAAVLAWFRETFAGDLRTHLPRFRPLDPQEIRSLAADGGFAFASHGHEHRILTRLDDAALRESLVGSRRLLEEATGAPVTQLAYPNGDHDPRVTGAVAAAGYTLAYTTRPGLVAGRRDALALPRVAVGGFDSPAVLRFQLLRALWRWRRQESGRPLEIVRRAREETS
ncbi:MAG TPA: polysaccharide deacetylase family protein [Candidatus Krumholzibacteria bacterium]|nr:polysaccharide deacetylase family protein [Candidatus Krumholzibacteria bacterium]HPD72014.1 polysaccharide deacetylase family protein [Candidatus Krumholzibacteria bacterium]HRY41053.1 polysaccharide deacetylase family protein [Candidatus Krumholzibacteria bacterium]